MPWKETCPMDEKIQFIAAVTADPRGNFTELCARFGISRAKGYKWVRRYNELGPAGLEARKPIAQACPHRTPDDIVDRILAMRKRHPYDGPKKLRSRLTKTDAGLALPAASTIGDILKRHGLIRPRRARLRVPPSAHPLAHATAPNDVWCTDFKGNFLLGDGARCYPLTITDAATRYLIKCEGMLQPRHEPVKEHFERAFREFGLPCAIRSDNGPPFATKMLGGLSSLAVWWIRLGIVPERIEPGKPQQNGRHERFHRTLGEQTASPPRGTLTSQQRAFDLFRRDYNDERPHEALGQETPSAHYEASLRVMPDRLSTPEYPEDYVVRWVWESGQFNWKGGAHNAGKALGKQPLGFHQIDQDEWEIFYGPILIGYAGVKDGVGVIERID